MLLAENSTKRCFSCGDVKPLGDFWCDNRRSAMANAKSRYGSCKTCKNKQRSIYDVLPNSDYAVIEGKKTCSTCSNKKSLVEFSPNKYFKDGRQGVCKTCKNDQKIVWKQTKGLPTRKPIAERETPREQRRKYRFGLTASAFKVMFDAQDGKCGICETAMDFLSRHTCIDHDHETGFIREILCGKCNLGLGHFSENIENMEKAIVYLRKHSEEHNEKVELKLINKSKETAE